MSVSLVYKGYSPVRAVLGRLSTVTDTPAEMRRMSRTEVETAIHQYVTKGSSLSKHVCFQRVWEVRH